MTEEVRRHAFEPFFTTKSVGAGTGLGLSMVYGFAKQSGGHVQLYSEAAQGTSVRVFLPILKHGQAVDVATAEDPAPTIPSGSELILVVEDDLRVRRVAVARLKDAGYRILEASNGTEALILFGQNPDIALLFTDMVMPGGLAGDKLAEEIRRLKPDIRVLFTSGYASPQIAGDRLSENEIWLKKPYTARELAIRLRELLD
jgi:CheY-like chemotaxis protein